MPIDHYYTLGNSGLRVSRLALGTMTFGTEWGWGSDEAGSKQIFADMSRSARFSLNIRWWSARSKMNLPPSRRALAWA